MSQAVYILCAITSLVCTVLLVRAYRQNRVPLLFWSGLCFLGLTVENFVLFLDKTVFPDVDLTMSVRIAALAALGGLALLIFGMVWKDK
ncbi:MAG: hypothetical protein JNM56_04140 [Planctomycetia bacterium]|nr:hypothetical protein [Planctomycetia bacterium]